MSNTYLPEPDANTRPSWDLTTPAERSAATRKREKAFRVAAFRAYGQAAGLSDEEARSLYGEWVKRASTTSTSAVR